jgi:hypothetical protein
MSLSTAEHWLFELLFWLWRLIKTIGAFAKANWPGARVKGYN